MTGPEHLIEFFHGYTYSATRWPAPPAWARWTPTQEEGLLTRASELQGYFAERRAFAARRAQRDRHPQHRPGGGIELAPRRAARQARLRRLPGLLRAGVLIRTTGDTIALSPPLIIERSQIDQIVDTLRGAIRRAA
jgi:beta-alanine--pyruvate transaminase